MLGSMSRMLHGPPTSNPNALRTRRRIVEILQKSEDDYTEEDYQHMKNVRSYCKRHMKQVRFTSAIRMWSPAVDFWL